MWMINIWPHGGRCEKPFFLNRFNWFQGRKYCQTKSKWILKNVCLNNIFKTLFYKLSQCSTIWHPYANLLMKNLFIIILSNLFPAISILFSETEIDWTLYCSRLLLLLKPVSKDSLIICLVQLVKSEWGLTSRQTSLLRHCHLLNVGYVVSRNRQFNYFIFYLAVHVIFYLIFCISDLYNVHFNG